MIQRRSAVARSEDLLRRERAYNVEHRIWPNVTRLIDRMLERRAELKAVYEELWTKLEPGAVEHFLWIIHDVGAVWDPTYLRGARKGHRRQVELRTEISELASKLAARLDERSELSEVSGFRTSGAYHIVDLIERASQANGSFRVNLRDPLQGLRREYDLKYWPSVADVVDAIADDALNVEISASDAITEAGTRSSRSSKADSFRALQSALEEYRGSIHSLIGADFRLSDESWATILNVMLDLGADEQVDGPYIKRLRQRDRDAIRHERNPPTAHVQTY